ncbi:MAG: FAD-dependent oxidoreductase [Alphaproteobacteria bacterium]|nr:FAD-dependent oxidoreductase [Alphaproteobacteria bacterium]
MTSTSKRNLLKGAAAATLIGTSARAADDGAYDVIVVGAGNAGLPTAIFAAARGLKVAIIEASGVIGGTLHLSSGQMSAAGTKLQKSKGIDDTPQIHYDDVMRISKGTADPVLLKLATENAAPTFDWLMDNGLTVDPKHPVTGTTHDPYSRERYAWSKDGGRAILKILETNLQPHVDSGKVTLMLQTEAKELIRDGGGAVTGIAVEDEKRQAKRVIGSNVVLTSGGYTFNPEMFQKLENAPIHTNMTYPFSMGAGYTMAIAAGGYVRGGQHHTPLFGAILADVDRPTQPRAMARHFPGDRPPWEIIVDAGGKRFLREDILSHDAYEQSLGKQPNERCWMVFDAEIMAKAPRLIGGGVTGPWTPEDTAEAFKTGDVPYFYTAATLEDLAKKAGLDAKGLAETVAAYNKAQASKAGDALGRQFMPLPINKAPYYAVEIHSWGLTSYAGVAVNGDLQVIKQDSTPIKGLYAAGEILGMGQLMGNSVCGGMSVTPALALGRLLGMKTLKA